MFYLFFYSIFLWGKGEAFAKKYHPAGELAPRDIVSRMIMAEMMETNAPNVFLDISHRDAE